MLVKILDADDQFVELLKSQTGTNTASKAYAHAAECYGMYLTANGLLELEIDTLRHKVARLESVIEGARSAAALLLDRTSQTDLDLSAGH